MARNMVIGGTDMILAVPVVRTRDKLLVYPHFSKTPLFALIEVSGKNYRILEVIENPYTRLERGKGRALAELLFSKRVDGLLTIGIGEGAFYHLVSGNISIYYIETSGKPIPLEEAMEKYLEGEAVLLREPPPHRHHRHHTGHH